MAISSTINPTQTTKPRAPIAGITSGLTFNNNATGQVQQPKPLLGIASLPSPNIGLTSTSETWIAKRDRENALQKASGISVAPPQETWKAKQDRENAAQLQTATASAAAQPIADAISQSFRAATSTTAPTPAPSTPTTGSAFASSLDGTTERTPGLASGGFVRGIASIGDKIDSFLGIGSTKKPVPASNTGTPQPQSPQSPQPQQSGTVQEQAVTSVKSRRSQEAEIMNGLAKGGIAGLIPGQIDPTVADDITINAKKGEYVVPQEVVSYLGVKYFSDIIAKARKALGFPQGIGPKSPDEPDNMGRMDKPRLRGIADISGLAAGGLIGLEDDPMTVGLIPIPPNTASTVKNPLTDPSVDGISGIGRLGLLANDAFAGRQRPIAGLEVPRQTNSFEQNTLGVTPDGSTISPKIYSSSDTVSNILKNDKNPFTGAVLGVAPETLQKDQYQNGNETSKNNYLITLDGNKGIGDTTAISNRVDWSPGSANVKGIADMSTYNEQVQRAKRHEALMNAPKDLGQQLLAVSRSLSDLF